MFIELTDTEEIKQAQLQMSAKLKKHFPHVQEREIGWPSGHFSAQVRFSKSNGADTAWWYTGSSDDKQTEYNLFGRGNPEELRMLLIDLQFNIPVKTFNRRQGGVFIQDVGSGKTLLGHRGIVTRGRSRVPCELLIQEANVTPRKIASYKSPNEVDVFFGGSY